MPQMQKSSRITHCSFDLATAFELVLRRTDVLDLNNQTGNAANFAVIEVTNSTAFNFMNHIETITKLTYTKGRHSLTIGTKPYHFRIQEMLCSCNFRMKIIILRHSTTQ